MSTFEELEVSQQMVAWADIKESHSRKRVLYAEAIGIEEIPVGNTIQQCLKLDYQGIYGYLPRSMIQKYEFRGINHLLGTTFEFVVEHLDHETQLFIANRITALDILASKFWKVAKEGQVYNAYISGLDRFNIFLLLDGVPTTMFRDEYSYMYFEDLREVLDIGESIQVQIAKLVKPGETYKRMVNGEEKEFTAGEEGYIEVSHRILTPDPWKHITNFKEKCVYTAKITKVHPDYGIFLDLIPGLTVRCNFPSNSNGVILKKGAKVALKIMAIDVQNRQIRAVVFSPKQGLYKKNNNNHNPRGLVR